MNVMKLKLNINAQWRRRIMLGLIALLIATGFFLGLRPQALEVDVASASRGTLRVTLEQEGRTRVQQRYVVTAPINGYARRILLEAGQPVARGAVLVELEPLRAEVLDPRRRAEAQARIGAAEDSVNATEQRAMAAASNTALAQAELQRVRALRPLGHVSAAAEDRATSEAERSAAEERSAQFAVATARHELAAARTALKYAASAGSFEVIAVRAPVAGSVLKVAHKSEGPVANGQPLIEIGDPKLLEVEVDLLSNDAVRVHPGTKVLFERWGGDGVLEGVVRVIEPAGFTKVSALGVEEQRVWVIVAFTSPVVQWQRLGDGYRVEASFILWDGKDILQIPASALFRDNGRWAVYLVEQGRAVKKRVQIGQSNGLYVQVLSGVTERAQVIVHPDDRVHQGVRVKARQGSGPAPFLPN